MYSWLCKIYLKSGKHFPRQGRKSQGNFMQTLHKIFRDLDPIFSSILSPIHLDSLHFLSYSHISHLICSAYSVNTAHGMFCARYT